MTRILFRKTYLLTLLIIGVTFWAFVTRMSPDGSSAEKEDSRHLSKHDRSKMLSDTLNEIEGEIASQKVFSSILLKKLKTKYVNKKKDGGESEVSPRGDSKQVQRPESAANEGSSTGAGKSKNSDKLKELQRELQQVGHPGEIQSLEVDKDGNIKQSLSKLEGLGKDPNYKDGEDFHQGEVLEVGGAPPLLDEEKPKNEDSGPRDSVIAVLVFVCNRPSVKRNLDQLFKFRPTPEKFPVVVSQDCGAHPATTSVIKAYGDKLTHIMQPDLSDIKVPPKEKKLKGYYNIARHYGWALNYTFNTLGYSNVLIVEDDLDIAPDFFEYFSATLPLLYEDPSLWCISAWNDNGKPKRINETAYDLLHRTDFFPGLGWLMTKSLWAELMVKWPRGYWDDWMREPPQRRDRACIRPEISRTSTFGKDGVSHGTYYQNHLRFIKLNDHFVPFTSMDLSYLHKDKYDVNFVKRVYSSQLVNSVDELKRITTDKDIIASSSQPIEYRLTYRTKVDFRMFAKKLEIMEDFRAGVPRTAYRGVVSFIFNNRTVYLAPGANWNSYQP